MREDLGAQEADESGLSGANLNLHTRGIRRELERDPRREPGQSSRAVVKIYQGEFHPMTEMKPRSTSREQEVRSPALTTRTNDFKTGLQDCLLNFRNAQPLAPATIRVGKIPQ